jgi:cysteine-S-conjugate beta-lyase
VAVPLEWSTYDDVRVEELRARGNAKWRHYEEGVLAAWVAEMDFPLAPPIRQALTEALAHNFVGYPPEAMATGLPEACAAWLAEAGLRVDADRVHLLPDVLTGLDLAIDAFTPSGSPVVVATPAYPPFFTIAGLSGRPVVEVPMVDQAGQHRFDLPAIDRAFADGARTLIVCNPHNPLGRVFSRGELEQLAQVVHTHGARVIADEVHSPLVYPGASYTPYAAVSPVAAAHSVTLMSASKGWNVPGLKCAQLILTNPADEEAWNRIPGLRRHGANTLGIVANRAAYQSGRAWLATTVAYLDRNRRHLGELLATLLPEVGYRQPEGTYLAWLDCRPLGLEQPAAFFLEHARVALSNGAAFGTPGQGFVRLNFATSSALLERIVTAMAKAVRAQTPVREG